MKVKTEHSQRHRHLGESIVGMTLDHERRQEQRKKMEEGEPGAAAMRQKVIKGGE